MRGNVIGIIICLLFVLVGLSACGGGGSSATTATGKFVDAPVEGLKYVSGGQSGFTGANGEFTYEIGQSVTFSVGGVVVGQAPGASVITPIELVKTAVPGTTVTASTPAVVQIAQFLLTASSLTSTGIKIDAAVTAACASQSINLSSSSTSGFTPIMTQIAATAGNRTVTTTADAQNHITASMNAIASGAPVVLPPATSIGGIVTVTVEQTASLYGNKYFGFAGGVVDGGIPSEIMYNDIDGYLILPHSSAQEVNQTYSSITKAPYGVYQDSNNGAPTDRFPVSAGTVYVFRSVMPFGSAAAYYKLEIISSTKRPDVDSTNYGVVTFKYVQILPIDIVNAVGRWQFADGSILAVLANTIYVDYTAADTKFFTVNGNYTNSSTLAGTFSLFNADNTVTTGGVTISLALTVDGKLNATLTGDTPLGSATLTGGIKQ